MKITVQIEDNKVNVLGNFKTAEEISRFIISIPTLQDKIVENITSKLSKELQAKVAAEINKSIVGSVSKQNADDEKLLRSSLRPILGARVDTAN